MQTHNTQLLAALREDSFQARTHTKNKNQYTDNGDDKIHSSLAKRKWYTSKHIYLFDRNFSCTVPLRIDFHCKIQKATISQLLPPHTKNQTNNGRIFSGSAQLDTSATIHFARGAQRRQRRRRRQRLFGTNFHHQLNWWCVHDHHDYDDDDDDRRRRTEERDFGRVRVLLHQQNPQQAATTTTTTTMTLATDAQYIYAWWLCGGSCVCLCTGMWIFQRRRANRQHVEHRPWWGNVRHAERRRTLLLLLWWWCRIDETGAAQQLTPPTAAAAADALLQTSNVFRHARGVVVDVLKCVCCFTWLGCCSSWLCPAVIRLLVLSLLYGLRYISFFRRCFVRWFVWYLNLHCLL